MADPVPDLIGKTITDAQLTTDSLDLVLAFSDGGGAVIKSFGGYDYNSHIEVEMD